MQHLTLVPSASQFLFRERPSHSYRASHPFALPLTKKKKERKSMKPRINRTPLLPGSSTPFLKDDVKLGGENICSMLLILSISKWNLLRANFLWKSIKSDLVLNTCCCLELQDSMFSWNHNLFSNNVFFSVLELNLLFKSSTQSGTWTYWHFVEKTSCSVIRGLNAE